MDGTLALIWLLTSLTDMGFSDCPTDCLRENPQTSRLSFRAANVQFQDRSINEELYVGLDASRSFGPFQPTMAASVTGDGDFWFGAGAKWTSQRVFDSPFFVETSLLPGVLKAGDGPDIGGALQFRSAFGIGYSFENGATLSVLYDHRSNADTQSVNPGLETLSLRYAIALN